MVARKGQVLISFWVDPEDRDAFKNLCATEEQGVSQVLRRFLHGCVQNQSLRVQIGDQVVESDESPLAQTTGVGVSQIQSILTRLADMERRLPSFLEPEDLKRIKNEILDGDADSMKHRLSELEWKVEKMDPGSLVWKERTKDQLTSKS